MPSVHPRRRSRALVAVLAAAATALTSFGAVVGLGGAAAADVRTYGGDDLRTSWDSAQPTLTPSSVSSSSFGTLFAAPVDGQVYAQPLVAGGTVIAATENNAVYGLDAATGRQSWSTSLGPAWPASAIGCGDLVPNIGVTSTPVYDAATGTVYLLAKVDDGPDGTQPHWYMHALDATTGQERPNWPVMIQGSPTNDPGRPFNAYTAMQRPGLLLMDGVVYAGFASHCGHGPYVGYVVGVDTGQARVSTLWATESGSSYAEGGIWQSGGGLVSDGPGHIIVTTGNGISPAPSPGSSPPVTLGESVVRLQVGPDGSLSAVDFFSPSNNAKLDQDDVDLGSGAPLAIPDGYGTPEHPHLLVQVGKDGRVYLLDRDDLGGMGQGPDGGDAVLGMTGPYGGVWGKPAFAGDGHGGGYVYTVEANGYLRAHELTTSGDVPRLASVATSAGTLGYTSGSPVVTSNGTDLSTALVWVVYVSGPDGAGAELRAYQALPSNGILTQRFAYPLGIGAKFSSLGTDNGRVFVGTRDGHVWGFGIPTKAALAASPVDFGPVAVDGSRQQTVTLTASRDVTVSSASAAAPFAVTPLGAPVSVPTGGTLSLDVGYAPTSWGSRSGALTVLTADGEKVSVDLHGFGTQPGVATSPGALDFGEVPVGAAKELTVNVVNTGTVDAVVTGSTPPGEPFTTSGVPDTGTVIRPQNSVPVSVRFSPTAAGSAGGSLTVATTQGDVGVPLTAGAIVGHAEMELPAVLDFGTVPVGLSVTRTFDITNSGNVPMIITKAKAPAGAFTSSSPLAENLTVPPDDTVHQTVTFTPTEVGPAPSEYYLITADDGRGMQQVELRGAGEDDPIAVAYERLGGAAIDSLLGPPLTPQYDITGVPGGRAQDFIRGTIYYSPATGAHELHGGNMAVYRALGGPTGALGLPTTDETSTPDHVGRYNDFVGGSIYWTPFTGSHAVAGPIHDVWTALGGAAGRLGYPATDETATPDGVGRYIDFSNGASVYWTPSTGAHAIYGAIRDKWLGMGGATGRLGYPTTDETGTSDGVGRYNDFSNGASVYWTPSTGPQAVYGSIREKWLATGGATGLLGYPTTDESPASDGAGRYNDFSNGATIYWSPVTGPAAVYGWIRVKWLALGGAAGILGHPVTDELGTPDGVGRYNHFSAGSIYWTPTTGANAVYGAIRATWAALGWDAGPLGYPTTDELGTPDGVGRYNHFTNGGSIYWTPTTGAHAVYGAIRATWAAMGWERSPLGYPTTDEYDVPGGRANGFQRGWLVFSWATGAVERR